MSDETVTNDVVVADNSAVSEDRFRSALKFFDEGQYNKALNILLNSSNLDTSGEYFNFTGDCYHKLGNAEEAIHYWKKAIQINPLCFPAYLNLGNAYFMLNSREKAMMYWHIATTIRPESAKANYNLGVAYAMKENRLSSIIFYEKFIKHSKDKSSHDYKKIRNFIMDIRARAESQLKNASVYFKNDYINAAVEFYLKSVHNYPLQPKVMLNLGRLFYADKNYETAIKYFKNAILLEERYAGVYKDIASSYVALKNYPYAYCYLIKIVNHFSTIEHDTADIALMANKIKRHIPQDYDSKIHYKSALDYEANFEFMEAIEEYDNYLILLGEANSEIENNIKRLKMFLYPETYVIKDLIQQINAMFAAKKYSTVIKLCTRIVDLSLSASQETLWATKKKRQVRQMMVK